jgi:hypothetical protein
MVLKCLLKDEIVIQNYVEELQPEDEIEGFTDDNDLFQNSFDTVERVGSDEAQDVVLDINNRLVPNPDAIPQNQITTNQNSSYEIPLNQVCFYNNSLFLHIKLIVIV